MGLQLYQKNLLEKLKESLGAVLPIIGIVLVLCFSIAPIPNSVLMTFVVGAVLLIIGMMFFTIRNENSASKIMSLNYEESTKGKTPNGSRY